MLKVNLTRSRTFLNNDRPDRRYPADFEMPHCFLGVPRRAISEPVRIRQEESGMIEQDVQKLLRRDQGPDLGKLEADI